jgi:hypothetical protein
LRESGTIPPEFQAVVTLSEEAPLSLSPAVELTRLSAAFGTMPWGCSLAFRRVDEGERFGALFDARLHHPRAVRVFLKRYRRLLGIVCAQPDRPLSELIPTRWRRFGPLLRRRVVGRR